MTYNYHTHTFRCRHAVGADEEYIKSAIACGVTHLGFADHMPYIFPDGHESTYRVPADQAEDYVTSLSVLREQYKEQIDVKIGFEMEYYPSHFDTMLTNAIHYGGEYLILGQHFTYEEHPDPRADYPIGPNPRPADLQNYVDSVVAGIHSGVFTYVAHPDLFYFSGDRAVYQAEMRKICVAAREKNIPLEINLLGIRDHRNYPEEAFWQIAGEEQSPVTFGCDAHQPEDVLDAASLKIAQKMVGAYHLNYIGKPNLIFIR